MNIKYLLLSAGIIFTTIFSISASAPENCMLYGHMISSTEPTQVLGIYQFSSTVGNNFQSITPAIAEPNCGAVKIGPRYYVLNKSNDGISDNYNIYVYDVDEQFLPVATIRSNANIVRENQLLAYNSHSKLLYAIDYDGYSSHLYTMDLNKATRTELCSLGTSKFCTFSTAPNGNLWAIRADGTLCHIDPTTLSLTTVGNTGVSPAMYLQSSTFGNYDSEHLYWAEAGETSGTLYCINTRDATSRFIADFPREEEFVSLWPGKIIPIDQAPAAPTQLQAHFNKGATQGEISFIIPDTLYNGQPLNQAVTALLYADGTILSEQTAQPRQQITVPCTLSRGKHHIVALLRNEQGYSPEAEITTLFVGHDTPKPVTDATAKRGTENNEIIITWQAPQTGVNGGNIDPANLKYEVTRLPDRTIVSSNATSPFTDHFTAEHPTRVFYDVVAYTDEQTRSLPMSTNKIMVGKPFEVPYTEDFSNSTNTLAYTIEDTNADDVTWQYQYDYGYMRIWTDEYTKDDWLFTPFIHLEENKNYVLSYDVKSFGTETLSVAMGTDARSDAMATTLSENSVVNSDDFQTQKIEFTATQSGPAFFGFHATTTDLANALALYIDNIQLQAHKGASLETLNTQPDRITIQSGKLCNIGNRIALLMVTTVDGRTLYHGDLDRGQSIPLSPGIYILRSGAHLHKVLVH